ncbi:MAG: LPS export ABC transporter periplasmic protein LptC [Bacteroidetes bacterium]|nr:LPS export ABC transporter periplasmic protein LptC [Bacteroidota bacterium]
MRRMGILLGIVGWVSACQPPENAPVDLNALRQGEPLSKSFHVRFMYTDSARVRARIQARSMEEVLEGTPPQRIRQANEGLHIIFYDIKGAQQSSLTAERGRLDESKGMAEALGNVVVTTVEGDVLETERLVWEQRKNRIYTNEFVKITRPGEIILADSLETDASFSFYKIYKIRGVIQVNE